MNYKDQSNRIKRNGVLGLYFLLPLLRLSKVSYEHVEGNCLAARLNVESKQIVVTVNKIQDVGSYAWWRHDNYLGEIQDQDTGTLDIYYSIPDDFSNDVANFTAGKYTMFSCRAVEMIRAYSGLKWRNQVNGVAYTDYRLMFFDPPKERIEELAAWLGVSSDILGEMFESPWENCFTKQSLEIE